MTPTLRIAAPTPSQIVRPSQSAGDPANTFDASLAAALTTRPITRDNGSAGGQAKGSDGDAGSTPARAGTTTATGTTTAPDGGTEASAPPPVEGSNEESAPVTAPPAMPFTLLNALATACVPTQPSDAVAAPVVGDALSATVAPAASVTAVAVAVTSDDVALALGDVASPTAATTLPAATSAASPEAAVTAATAGATQPGAVPASPMPAVAEGDGVVAPLPTPQNAPAAPSAAAGQQPATVPAGQVDTAVAALATAATAAPVPTTPAGGETPDGATAPAGATPVAAPIAGGAPSGAATPDLTTGGQPPALPPAADAGDAAKPGTPVTGTPVPVAPTDGETLATPPATAGQVVDEPTAVAYGVPGTDALKRAVALADAVDATPVELTASTAAIADDGPAAKITSNSAAPQPIAPAAPRDVPAALPTVTAAAPAPAPTPTPVATATPTQQSNLPGSVPPPHQQVATAVSPMLRRADGSYSVNINLEPEHLGRVSLQVHIRGGEVAVTMQAADASARELLRDNLGQLRQQLEQQGVKAGQLDVRDDSAFARQFQSPQGDGRSADSRVNGHRATGAGSDEPTSPDSSLQESTVGQPDDTGALDLHL